MQWQNFGVVATALFRDIGNALTPFNHDSSVSAILKPYVREECTWITENHGLIQKEYYTRHFSRYLDTHDAYRNHRLPPTQYLVLQTLAPGSIRPGYVTLELALFEPMVDSIFGHVAHNPAQILPGTVGAA